MGRSGVACDGITGRPRLHGAATRRHRPGRGPRDGPRDRQRAVVERRRASAADGSPSLWSRVAHTGAACPSPGSEPARFAPQPQRHGLLPRDVRGRWAQVGAFVALPCADEVREDAMKPAR